jgi:2,4-dienoyl-CoA reductase-like NADH-dependent reductase (Old Yellow Enzyme family)
MIDAAVEILTSPCQLGSLMLSNRIVMAPMTRAFSPGGIPEAKTATYYRRRAEGGVGLIVSEGVAIERPAARNDPNVPHFYGAEALAGWRTVIDDVHAAGGRMAPQLWHVGSAAHHDPATTWMAPGPVDSPSGIQSRGSRASDPMSEEAIADTLAAYGRAAGDARRLGFDAVEIHGAHGYLIDQFFSHTTNRRIDRFGGASIKERAQFGVEVAKSVRRAAGPGFPVILRVSQWKNWDYRARVARTPQEMSQWLTPLVEAGVDALHCSQRRFWEPEFPEVDGSQGLNFAGWAKKLTGATCISVGSVGLSGDFVNALQQGERSEPASLTALVKRMEREEFDLIAVGRALLSDPHWVLKIRSGETHALQGYDSAALKDLI